MAISISVTSLQSVLDCPLCFWLDERIGSAPSIFPGIPNQMDSVIKEYMRKFIGRSDLPGWFPIRGKFIDITQMMRATDPATGVTVKGKLDALVSAPGGYHVIDYKTGRPPKEIPNYYQMQLDGYAYLLERNGYEPVAGGCLIYFTPEPGDISQGCFPFRITPLQARLDSGRIPPVLVRVKEILESPTPPPRSEDCEMCMWLEQAGRALSE